MRVVIIGGVAGGMSAATRMRRLDESAEIIVLERGGYVSFANCGLPYYVGGVIPQRGALLLQTPESLAARFALDVRVRSEVVTIDRERRIVRVRRVGEPAGYELAYDKLILSPGASPVRPPIPGIERAMSLRGVEDADALAGACAKAATAVVIGGGFIGIEVAENLVHKGLHVALIEAMPQVMAPLDPEMAAPVHDVLRAAGVDLRLGAAVSGITSDGVLLADGQQVPGELIVAAIGVRPEADLARQAGLAIGEHGGIVVDEACRTSDPDIYAIGDAAGKRDALDGSATLVPLAGTASLQGRRVADHIAGLGGAARPVRGAAIVGAFGLQIAAVGWNEKRLRAAGREFQAIHAHPASHAGYYPGAVGMSLKLLLDPGTGQILGAQGTGRAGIDRAIDIIAVAMAGGITASALADLELVYAPAFSSAKDPVNMLGYVADNLRTGHARTIQWWQVSAEAAAGAVVVDVRTRAEHERGAVTGAINLPLDELRDHVTELRGKRVIVHCQVGQRGHTAARLLAQHGIDVVNLDGGYLTWSAGMSAATLA